MATVGLEYVIISCGHGNRANPVVSCVKFDAHTHCHCQVIRVPGLSVAMATIED